ncbi:hypothetical protein C0J52_11255 [Blattella germanica]|nr:hypothetical protein C0J52_11255 [Blattella germanica]
MDFGAWGPWETPYTHLSEEYLIHFLPCDGSAVPPPTRSPTLFRQSVILKQSTASSSLHSSPTLPQQSSLVEIWRSESVIQVFIDFWLNCGEKEKSQFGAGTPSRDFLPTIEHIRVVRNLIKHLHYFASSIVGDMSAMDELKRIILPSSQSKIYGFLRHTINHWPLDSSFRLILETWLSYIQPWRYTDWRLKNTRSVGGRESEERVRVVDNYWQNFIAENLLSYTVIFRQLLPRFMRLDLATPKNAHMLFRVTKVFQFMLQIQMSIDSARNLIVKLERETSDKKTGFFSSLYDFFFSPPLEVDEYSMDERKKVIAYLETCLGQLSNIFDIDRSRLPCMSYSGTYEIPHCSTLGATTAQQEEILSATPPSPISSLAPREWKARRKHIKYEGDPDLEPIRTNENAFLVKLLYHITSKLNEMYTLEMCHLYEHRGLLGCIARQVLSPPMVARTFDKSKPGFSPQVETILPPRLSLRSFASHKSIVYLLIGLLFCWLLGYGLATYVVILLIFWIVWTFLKVLYESIFGRNIHRLN